MKLPFNVSDWDFEKLTHRKSMADRKRMERSANKFGEWILDIFKRTAPRPLEQGEKYHCQGMRLHPDNNLYLRDHIDPWTWVYYSPKDDDSLSLDELEIYHWFDERRVK